MQRFVPSSFEPRTHNGRGVGGICMIRFRQLRPKGFAPAFGINSENAAHRVAVQWTKDGTPHEGVYIPRRDTASTFNFWAGGRVFPGILSRAQFTVQENDGHYHVEIASPNEAPHVVFDGEDTSEYSASSIFSNLDGASDFIAKGAVGYSAAQDPGHFEGMELRLLEWHISPLNMNNAYVRLHEDGAAFPEGSVQIESAMVMRRLRHERHNIPAIHI